MARSRAEVIGLPFVLSRRHGIISVDPHPTHGIRNHCHGVLSLSGAVAPCRTSSLRVVRERKPARGVGGSYISTLACRSGRLARPTARGPAWPPRSVGGVEWPLTWWEQLDSRG